MRLNKWQLDFLCSMCGLIIGTSIILTTSNVLPLHLGRIIEGIGIMVLGCLTQRPTDARPTTEQVEEHEVQH